MRYQPGILFSKTNFGLDIGVHFTWDRVIKLTGNTENDFKNVIQFLEKNQILEGKRSHIGRFPSQSSNPKIDRYLFEISVNGEIVEAEFIEYISNKEFYLNDEWIKTRN